METRKNIQSSQFKKQKSCIWVAVAVREKNKKNNVPLSISVHIYLYQLISSLLYSFIPIYCIHILYPLYPYPCYIHLYLVCVYIYLYPFPSCFYFFHFLVSTKYYSHIFRLLLSSLILPISCIIPLFYWR